MTALTANLNPRAAAPFKIDHATGPAALLRPHRMGNKLWKPMFAMGIMGLGVSLALAIVRASLIGDADPGDAETIEQLRHFVTGTLFLGFTGIFAAISFAIARILGVFRVGGSQVQDDVTTDVHTLKMPVTAKAFVMLMMMGMMGVAVGSVANIIAGVSFTEAADLVDSQQWYVFSAGLRRVGVALYLTGITLGLVTIINVIRFQTMRIRELA